MLPQEETDFPKVGYAGFLVMGIGKFGYSLAEEVKAILRSGCALIIKITNKVESYNGILQKADFLFVFADINNKNDLLVAKSVCEMAKDHVAITCLCTSDAKLPEYNLIKDSVHTVITISKKMKRQYPIFTKRFIESITLPSLVGLDYADITYIIKSGKWATIGIGKSSGSAKLQKAVKSALSKLSKKGMNNMFIHIQGGQDITLDEINEISEIGTNWATESANVIWAAQVDEKFKNKLEVHCLITYNNFIKSEKGI